MQKGLSQSYSILCLTQKGYRRSVLGHRRDVAGILVAIVNLKCSKHALQVCVYVRCVDGQIAASPATTYTA